MAVVLDKARMLKERLLKKYALLEQMNESILRNATLTMTVRVVPVSDHKRGDWVRDLGRRERVKNIVLKNVTRMIIRVV